MAEKFYVTTPIYYVNARPHIGHAYTTIVADVLARRHRMLGTAPETGALPDTWFLTGTDEHGQKIERSAAAAGIPPQQFADEVSASFRTLWDRMGLTYDQYIRTTDEAHKRGVQKLFTTLQEKGAIYLDSYTGAYCVSDEAFVDAPAGTPCPDCGRTLETVTEENYFFKLSEYQLPLLHLIESNELVIEPEARRNEVLSFLRGGLRDLSISRSSFTWGIPVPPSSTELTTENGQLTTAPHVIYVWLDALANYMTAVGYGDDSPEGKAKFAKYWPADLHIVGKEIIRFHCVYWPAFLLAADIALPKKVVAHGWLLFDDSKMSKSKGNIVRTETILDAFGPLCPPPAAGTAPESGGPSFAPSAKGGFSSEARPSHSTLSSNATSDAPPSTSKHHQDLFAADILRYFLLREIPFGQDGSFSFDALITRYNADLTNGYGNLVSRVLTLVSTNCHQAFPEQPETFSTKVSTLNTNLESLAMLIISVMPEEYENCRFTRIITSVQGLIGQTDTLLNDVKPWKLFKSESQQDRKKASDVLYTASESIRIITMLLHPILPYATTRVWQQLGLDPAELTTYHSPLTTLQWGGLKPGTKLGPLSPIFPRADKGLAQIMADAELPKITDNNDALTPASGDLPTAPIASEAPRSKLVDETFVQPPVPATTFDPAAGPRTATLAEPSPGSQVAGSTAHTTERPDVIAPATDLGAPGLASETRVSDQSPQIAIDDFIKIDLRVAKILVAERIPKADKLLRLEVDLGYEKRQILSGIAEHYTPEQLIGRRIVVIVNLAPRKMRGLESHGMLLAASAPDVEGKPGKPILATFPEAEELPLGSRLK